MKKELTSHTQYLDDQPGSNLIARIDRIRSQKTEQLRRTPIEDGNLDSSKAAVQWDQYR